MENLLMHQYKHYSHSVGVLMLHLEWCTKYRYKMFRKEEQKNLASACIRRAASLHGIKIIVLMVMPEHVHTEVQVPLSMSPAKVLQILKGLSAKLFFMKNQKTAMSVAEARGAIMLSAAESGLSVKEFSPNEVKAGITGYGLADKKAVLKMVRLILNQPSLNLIDDASDALAIAIVASQGG